MAKTWAFVYICFHIRVLLKSILKRNTHPINALKVTDSHVDQTQAREISSYTTQRRHSLHPHNKSKSLCPTQSRRRIPQDTSPEGADAWWRVSWLQSTQQQEWVPSSSGYFMILDPCSRGWSCSSPLLHSLGEISTNLLSSLTQQENKPTDQPIATFLVWVKELI